MAGMGNMWAAISIAQTATNPLDILLEICALKSTFSGTRNGQVSWNHIYEVCCVIPIAAEKTNKVAMNGISIAANPITAVHRRCPFIAARSKR